MKDNRLALGCIAIIFMVIGAIATGIFVGWLVKLLVVNIMGIA